MTELETIAWRLEAKELAMEFFRAALMLPPTATDEFPYPQVENAIVDLTAKVPKTGGKRLQFLVLASELEQARERAKAAGIGRAYRMLCPWIIDDGTPFTPPSSFWYHVTAKDIQYRHGTSYCYPYRSNILDMNAMLRLQSLLHETSKL